MYPASSPGSMSDHPRACGELPAWHRSIRADGGSSPRMRGTRGRRRLGLRFRRIIPAHAGNSARRIAAPPGTADHPRACGELSSRPASSRVSAGSSPRMRGTQPLTAGSPGLVRIIPAHAGNSRAVPAHAGGAADHPRACGELPAVRSVLSDQFGSSPRMRGTRPDSIAAW